MSLFDKVKITASPFKVEVLSYKDQTTPIWTTAEHSFFLSEYLVTLGADLLTQNGTEFTPAFGLGERYGDFFLQSGKYAFWNRGGKNQVTTGMLPGQNTYSTHPLIAWRTPKGTFGSQFVLNSAANDVTILNNKTDGMISYTQVAVGGPIDIYVTEGDLPDDLVQSYHSFVGFPELVPMWLLGWNQCRQDVADLTEFEQIRKNYTDMGIPLDVMWSDLDYLKDYRNLEVDTTRYPDLQSYVSKNLYKNNQTYVVAIDASIPMIDDHTYPPYTEGLKMGVFIKDYSNMTVLQGKSQAGNAAFIDWTSANVQTHWNQFVKTLHDRTGAQGFWLKNNEALNECDGSCMLSQLPLESVNFKLQYWPSGRNLNNLALSVDAMHANNMTELALHNQYGQMQAKTTSDWFHSQYQQRAVVMSESAFAGSGKFGQKTLGDNYSTAQSMGYSLASIMSMNMFGFPATGADVCGFIGNADPELCARWTMLAMYYPFARTNNAKGQQP